MAVSIDIREAAGVRTLHFGSDWIQGAMRMARPWQLELAYTRDMMAPLLLRERLPRHVLQIGLGAASLTRFLYRHVPEARLTVVEIEPAVVAAARQFFKLPEDSKRLHLVIGDGADYVADAGSPFDLILVDGFDARARAGRLGTLSFYLACRARLSRRGLLAANLLSRSRNFQRNVADLDNAFEGRSLVLPCVESGNAVALAAAGDPLAWPLEALRRKADTLKQGTGLNLLPLWSRVEQARHCPGGILAL